MRVIERSFSDVLRHPNDVTADLDAGDVLLRRRDEPDLRLTLADRDAERSDVFRVLALSFRNLAVHSPGVGGAVSDSFAWSEFLPVRDRRLFLDEFSRTLIASADMDTYELLAQLVREWRATAEVYAQPGLAKVFVGRSRRLTVEPFRFLPGCELCRNVAKGSAASNVARLGLSIRNKRCGDWMGADLLGSVRERPSRMGEADY